MQRSNPHTRLKWLGAILLILLLTAMGSQNVLPQNLVVEYPLGDIPLAPATYQKHLKVFPESMLAAELPLAYDARDMGIVTPAKSQGSCGSCWAFANTGAMESHILAKYGGDPAQLDLAEQQMVSCELDSFGCCGGYPYVDYWETQGPILETCFSYAESGTPCSTAERTVPCSESAGCEQLPYRVEPGSWGSVPATTEGFKTSLYAEGPGYFRYKVYKDFDSFWSNGSPGDVYTAAPGYDYRGSHAVLLIGWDDDKAAFLCKNSWGTTGGPNNDGTFWIAYTGHNPDLGLGMYNFSITSLTCSSDAECDDGAFCNGSETCVDGACQEGTPPACTDDGFFCNGSEFCDEANDTCGSTGDPCTSGTVCNETSDTCDLSSCGNGVCDEGENCHNCSDCISGTAGGTCEACFKGVCDGSCHPVKEDDTCTDCAPGYCCGDGACQGEENGFNCAIDCGAPPVCGDLSCDPGEDQCNCSADCGQPFASEAGYCSDGINNDCDAYLDCADPDCASSPDCSCSPRGNVCTENSDCCSNRCHRGVCK